MHTLLKDSGARREERPAVKDGKLTHLKQEYVCKLDCRKDILSLCFSYNFSYTSFLHYLPKFVILHAFRINGYIKQEKNLRDFHC